MIEDSRSPVLPVPPASPLAVPRWAKWIWAVGVTLSTCGNWVVSWCYPPGDVGAALEVIRSYRRGSVVPPSKAIAPTLPLDAQKPGLSR
jgi:hypothetical protein